ncbi:hypothetical protein ACFHYQ_06095 [Sphaerimonospora cavernae]|uniref:Uncharacterized protein n=1 Tax=Sphaerimonospora cavernae TaxID=1740611 RepID=A0ABV6U1I4_9ACTN
MNETDAELIRFIRSCPGLHAAAPQEGYERVNWRESLPRADRVRVRRHTCDCKPIVYELCQGGGLYFVRRLYRSDEVLVHESEWLRSPEAERLWLQVLMGQAR